MSDRMTVKDLKKELDELINLGYGDTLVMIDSLYVHNGYIKYSTNNRLEFRDGVQVLNL